MKSTDEIIHQVFNAESVAVVGASADPSKYGYMTLDCIIKGGFRGRIYPVNPKTPEILGIKAYASLETLPETPDVAVILVPVTVVPHVLRDAGKKGIPTAVITTAGYREVGRADLQDELSAIATEENIRIIGPNIEGFIYMPNRLNAQFFPVLKNSGPLATISQSGSLTNGLAEWADRDGLGISACINLGNQADICEADFMEYLARDPHTRAMALYLEGVKDGRRFLSALQRVAPEKPVVILKAGRSSAGLKSVASHTASLAGGHELFSAACRQFGAFPVNDLATLYDYGKLLATLPVPKGNRLLVISSSGGIGVLAADEAESAGIALPDLPDGFVKEVESLNLSPLGSVANPMDLAAIWAEEFYEAACLADKYDVADVILINFGDPIRDGGETLIKLSKKIKAGIAVAYMGGSEDELRDRPRLNQAGIPVFSTPERAVRAIGAAMAFGKFSRTHSADLLPLPRVPENRDDTPSLIPEPEAVALLKTYNIDYPAHCFVKTVDDACTAADRIGYPLVLKVVSPDVPHKSDAGGVQVNLESEEDLRHAYTAIEQDVSAHLPEADIQGCLVCSQAAPGLELIVGAVTDPVFGPSVIVGMGGIYTEVLSDVSQRVAPVSLEEARNMIRELKGYPLLAGARGAAALDIDGLAHLITRVSDIVLDHPGITELDLNPVRIYQDRVTVLDARILDARLLKSK
ncbi:MAG: acetate--CoA ligase family protein [Desulfobacterales bacterium]|nr:acetate--CoA ligase family protein [Desulfobacterales bacterium]